MPGDSGHPRVRRMDELSIHRPARLNFQHWYNPVSTARRLRFLSSKDRFAHFTCTAPYMPFPSCAWQKYP